MKLNKLAPICIAIVASALVQCSIAEEPGELLDGTKPEKIVSAMQELGFRSKLEVDSDGDPVIRSGVGGSDFSIQFYGCTEDNNDQCSILLFVVSYKLDEETTLEAINTWNEMSLFGRAYLDKGGDPVLDWAVNMNGGVSRENFEDAIDIWEERVASFERHIEF